MVEVGGRRQIAEVTSGGSYYSQNSLTLTSVWATPNRRTASKCNGPPEQSRSGRTSLRNRTLQDHRRRTVGLHPAVHSPAKVPRT